MDIVAIIKEIWKDDASMERRMNLLFEYFNRPYLLEDASQGMDGGQATTTLIYKSVDFAIINVVGSIEGGPNVPPPSPPTVTSTKTFDDGSDTLLVPYKANNSIQAKDYKLVKEAKHGLHININKGHILFGEKIRQSKYTFNSNHSFRLLAECLEIVPDHGARVSFDLQPSQMAKLSIDGGDTVVLFVANDHKVTLYLDNHSMLTITTANYEHVIKPTVMVKLIDLNDNVEVKDDRKEESSLMSIEMLEDHHHQDPSPLMKVKVMLPMASGGTTNTTTTSEQEKDDLFEMFTNMVKADVLEMCNKPPEVVPKESTEVDAKITTQSSDIRKMLSRIKLRPRSSTKKVAGTTTNRTKKTDVSMSLNHVNQAQSIYLAKPAKSKKAGTQTKDPLRKARQHKTAMHDLSKSMQYITLIQQFASKRIRNHTELDTEVKLKFEKQSEKLLTYLSATIESVERYLNIDSGLQQSSTTNNFNDQIIEKLVKYIHDIGESHDILFRLELIGDLYDTLLVVSHKLNSFK